MYKRKNDGDKGDARKARWWHTATPYWQNKKTCDLAIVWPPSSELSLLVESDGYNNHCKQDPEAYTVRENVDCSKHYNQSNSLRMSVAEGNDCVSERRVENINEAFQDVP